MTDNYSSDNIEIVGDHIERTQQREFTGVWIPAYVFLDPGLSSTDKMVYANIACFNQCFMSNAHLAKKMSLSERQISSIIGKLKAKGYVIQDGFDGRKRYLSARANLPVQKPVDEDVPVMQPSDEVPTSMEENREADTTKTSTIENKRDHILDKTLYFEGENASSLRKALVAVLGIPQGAYDAFDGPELDLLRNSLDEGERRLISKGATAKDIFTRSARFKKRIRKPLTATMLAEHWHELGSTRTPTHAPNKQQGEFWELDAQGNAVRSHGK